METVPVKTLGKWHRAVETWRTIILSSPQNNPFAKKQQWQWPDYGRLLRVKDHENLMDLFRREFTCKGIILSQFLGFKLLILCSSMAQQVLFIMQWLPMTHKIKTRILDKTHGALPGLVSHCLTSSLSYPLSSGATGFSSLKGPRAPWTLKL